MDENPAVGWWRPATLTTAASTTSPRRPADVRMIWTRADIACRQDSGWRSGLIGECFVDVLFVMCCVIADDDDDGLEANGMKTGRKTQPEKTHEFGFGCEHNNVAGANVVQSIMFSSVRMPENKTQSPYE